MWEERALRNLLDVKHVFDKNYIKFWLDYGTLLGAIRDRKLVRHMGDIDLGMMDEDWEKFTYSLKEFTDRGFSVMIKKFDVEGNIFRTAKLHRYGIYVDLSIYKILDKYAIDIHDHWGDMNFKFIRFTYYIFPFPRSFKRFINNGDDLLRNFIIDHFEILLKAKMSKSQAIRWLLGWKSYFYNKIPRKYFENLDKTNLYGVLFNTPSPVEEYLKYMYGETWKTPKKRWGYADNGSFRVFVTRNSIESCEYFEKPILKEDQL